MGTIYRSVRKVVAERQQILRVASRYARLNRMDETSPRRRVAASEGMRGPVLASSEPTGVVSAFLMKEQWCFPDPPVWSAKLAQMICPLSYWPANRSSALWRSRPDPHEIVGGDPFEPFASPNSPFGAEIGLEQRVVKDLILHRIELACNGLSISFIVSMPKTRPREES